MFSRSFLTKNFFSQPLAGVVVFLVALPLSLGIALTSGAPLISGLLGGMVGGLVVGLLSGSQVSVSGPSAALAAIVAQQIGGLRSFEAFLLALFFAGLIQVVLGCCRGGFIAEFFPSSVIKGLLAATGILIALKQIPHLLGYDPVVFGDSSFWEWDGNNTFSAIRCAVTHLQWGALLVGVTSLLFLVLSNRLKCLKSLPIPAPLFVVIMSVIANGMLGHIGSSWDINATHLVKIPDIPTPAAFLTTLRFPDWQQWLQPGIYAAAIFIAISASLETLLNLEATDRIDPEQHVSPPNRELIAHGIGNMILGLIGGIPVTSAIVRSTANITAGGRTRWSTVTHGLFLLASILFLSRWINQIPLATLAAILVVVGMKLAQPQLFVKLWREGSNQFVPFCATILAIIFTNLLFGILIGLGVGLLFLLHNNLYRPIHQVLERHAAGDVLRLELANQVSFLNRPSLMKALDAVPVKSHLFIDARATDYIDPDIISLIHDFIQSKAKVRNITVSLLGFQEKYQRMKDVIRFVDYSTQELQSKLLPEEVMAIMREGNERFWQGRPLQRDLRRQVRETSEAQYPMGVVLSCIDSRAPVEMVFDAGLGDFFSIRMAGQVANERELASMEYSCVVAGAKLIIVLGHTSCGAVGAALEFYQKKTTAQQAAGCEHLDLLLKEIQQSIDPSTPATFSSAEEKKKWTNELARRHVSATIIFIRKESPSLRRLEEEGTIAIVGAFYDLATGKVEFL
ncbi:MAG: SulP family inorganic anion transporter [Verrucomicrobiae bacterium]|nr:SulP family inorganic anion transporter [Verrucomicrobiae bacterium]